MRLAHAIFLASMAGLLTLAAPTLAKNSNAPKAAEPTDASACHAYQQAPDGSWLQLPCQETGATGHTQHKPAAQGSSDETH